GIASARSLPHHLDPVVRRKSEHVIQSRASQPGSSHLLPLDRPDSGRDVSMHKKALVAMILSVFAAATAAAQTSPNLAIGSAQPPDSIFAASGPSCIGGVEADDGTFETGYVALGGIESRMVQRLTPPVHPSLLTRACLCWISENASASTLS